MYIRLRQAETFVGAHRVNLPPSNKDAGIENCFPVSSVSVRGGLRTKVEDLSSALVIRSVRAI